MISDLPLTDPRHISLLPSALLESRYHLASLVFSHSNDLAKRDDAMRELAAIKNEMQRRGMVA